MHRLLHRPNRGPCNQFHASQINSYYRPTCHMIPNKIVSYMSPKIRFLHRQSLEVQIEDKVDTHSRTGASLKNVLPPTISRVQTSLMNQPTCPTAHPTRSPAAALQVPFNTHENATRATGRYGAVIVKSPNKEIGVDGCLRDHR